MGHWWMAVCGAKVRGFYYCPRYVQPEAAAQSRCTGQRVPGGPTGRRLPTRRRPATVPRAVGTRPSLDRATAARLAQKQNAAPARSRNRTRRVSAQARLALRGGYCSCDGPHSLVAEKRPTDRTRPQHDGTAPTEMAHNRSTAPARSGNKTRRVSTQATPERSVVRAAPATGHTHGWRRNAQPIARCGRRHRLPRDGKRARERARARSSGAGAWCWCNEAAVAAWCRCVLAHMR